MYQAARNVLPTHTFALLAAEMDAPDARKPSGTAPPRFTQLLKDIETHEGEKVQFDCKVVGNPPPMVKWYRGKMEIQSSLDFQVRPPTI